MVGSEIGRLPPQFGDASKVKFLYSPPIIKLNCIKIIYNF